MASAEEMQQDLPSIPAKELQQDPPPVPERIEAMWPRGGE
jgi:hypothetical protein